MRSAMSLSVADARRHGAFGILSEVGEIISPLKASFFYGKLLDLDNVKEEIGDAAWFAVYLCAAHGTTIPESESGGSTIAVVLTGFPEYALISSDVQRATAIVGCTAALLYAKSQDRVIGPGEIANTAALFIAALAYLGATLGLNFGDVLQHNIDKLKRRYPGKYSDEAAIARADKPTGE